MCTENLKILSLHLGSTKKVDVDVDLFIENINLTITFYVVKRDELEYTAVVENNIRSRISVDRRE